MHGCYLKIWLIAALERREEFFFSAHVPVLLLCLSPVESASYTFGTETIIGKRNYFAKQNCETFFGLLLSGEGIGNPEGGF